MSAPDPLSLKSLDGLSGDERKRRMAAAVADLERRRGKPTQADLEAAVKRALEWAASHCKTTAENCKEYGLAEAAGMSFSLSREIRAASPDTIAKLARGE
jgi:hypothetical protein